MKNIYLNFFIKYEIKLFRNLFRSNFIIKLNQDKVLLIKRFKNRGY